MKSQNMSDRTWSKNHHLEPVLFECSHPTATSVSIAGTFNEWNPTNELMIHDGRGYWQKEIILAPGTYEYCLVVDGRWGPDPLSKYQIMNPFGGRNSILNVPTYLDEKNIIELEEDFFSNYY